MRWGRAGFRPNVTDTAGWTGDNGCVSLHLDGRGGIRTHGTLLTYTHFPGVRLKPLGHPSQHRFEARSISKPRVTAHSVADCEQLRTADSRTPCAIRRSYQTDRERFELSIPGSPVCRFSR